MPTAHFLDAVRIGRPGGTKFTPLRPMVDDTADHSMVLAALLKELQVTELERRPCLLADGTVAECGMGIASFDIDGRVRPCPVVFGPGDTPLIGASTLQIFNLEYDTANHRLTPTPNLSLGMVGADGELHPSPEPIRPTMVAPRDGYHIWLRFSDGAAGEVDLSHLAGQGVFLRWDDRKFFESVGFGEGGAIAWGNNIELCPDTLYAQLTGKPIEHP